MQQQHVPDISNLITSDGHFRDAIHVAISPVQAGETLFPGEKIKLEGGVAISVERAEDSIGVVSPFLKDQVKEGEWFYMFLNPNTVQNLRHTWQLIGFNPKRRGEGE